MCSVWHGPRECETGEAPAKRLACTPLSWASSSSIRGANRSVRTRSSLRTRLRAGGTNRELVGHKLFGKTLGVIGCGNIGLQVARLGNAFGCHVLSFARRVLRIDDVTIEQVEIDELLSRSDIVTLHLPLTAETLGFIGREQLARMKPLISWPSWKRWNTIGLPAQASMCLI
jgi:hypothetical protein